MPKGIRRSHGKTTRPDAKAIARFISFLDLDGPVPAVKGVAGCCWLWKGCVDHYGYGQFRWGNRAWWAPRVAWLIFNGKLIAGHEIDHRCCTSGCCNPDHLYQPTCRVNRKRAGKRILVRSQDIPI